MPIKVDDGDAIATGSVRSDAGAARDALAADEAGQDLAEYAILSSLIAVVVIGAITLLGNRLLTLFQSIVSSLPFAGS